PGRRPGPVRVGGRGRLLRRDRADARRPRPARAADRGTAAAGDPLVRRDAGDAGPRAPARRGPRVRYPRREGVLHDAGAGRRLRPRPRRPPGGLAHAPAFVAQGPRPRPCPRAEGPGGHAVRIGIVCPYSWDVPGGVQFHIRDLAEYFIRLGHEVSVLAPADDDTPLPPYVVSAGRAVPVPYNGSVARLNFGFLSAARVRRWLHEGAFDVIHIHEPTSPSLGLLTCWAAQGPIVATFHTSNPRSRAMIAAYAILQAALEKISARIAVSEYARRTLV